MKQNEFLEIIELNKGKHRQPIEVLVLGRKYDVNAHSLPEPIKETRVVAKFNVTSTSDPIKIIYSDLYGSSISQFDEIEIDGVTQPNVIAEYTFNTLGEHTVKYVLKDPTVIGYKAFERCLNLTSITIPDSVTSIGNSAFSVCNNLASISIPDTVTSIGSTAFNGCAMTLINIPSSVTNIGDSAFTSCTNLTSITIPNGITTIKYCTFQDCSNLTSITIPDSVTSIERLAFYRCSKLNSITCNAITAPSIVSNTFESIKNYGTLYVPTGSTNYNTWMNSGQYYLGYWLWIKVEQ